MPKIDHVTLQYTDISQMEQIPSDFIEPYLVKFHLAVIESVAEGWRTPAEARGEINGVMRFINLFGGLHARMATSNVYSKFCELSDEDMIKICKETFKDL